MAAGKGLSPPVPSSWAASARPASSPAGGRGACQWPEASRPRASGFGVPPGGPAGRVGRGEVRTPPGAGGGRARLRPGEGAAVCTAARWPRGPGRGGTAPAKRFWTPPDCGVGEVKASVNRRRLCLPPPRGCSLPEPLRRSPSPAQWVLRRPFPWRWSQIVFLPGGEIGKLWMQVFLKKKIFFFKCNIKGD